MVDISVIIPTHNSIKYLDECITSILNQSLSNIEVIAIDSSSDGTDELLKDYSTKDKRLTVICDSNSSYGHKMNVGIKLAKGSYIAFVESDDYIDQDMLKKLFYVAKWHNFPDLVKADYDGFFDATSDRLFYPVHRTEDCNYDRLIQLDKEASLRMCIEYNIWSGIYKRDYLIKNEIEFHESPGASFQDIGFSNQIALMTQTAVYVKDCLYKYRMDNEGSSVKSDEKYALVQKEFDYLYKRMIENPKYHFNEIGRVFLGIKKVESYEWNLNRLSPQYREMFLDSINDEDLDVTNCEMLNYSKSRLNEKISLLRREDMYDRFLSSKKTIDNSFKLLEGLFNEKELIILGAGKRCEAIICFYIMGSYTTNIHLCDNNKEGSILAIGSKQYEITSLEKICKPEDRTKVLISSYANKNEMLEQLEIIGVSNERICVCEQIPYGTDLFEAFGRYRRGQI